MLNSRCGPVTIEHDLVRGLWKAVIEARNDALNEKRQAEARIARCDLLISQMKDAGMNRWIPTLDEVSAAWNAE